MEIKLPNKVATLAFVLVLLLLVFSYIFFIKPVTDKKNQTTSTTIQMPISQILPDEISPEGVKELIDNKTPFLLVNADDYDPKSIAAPGPLRLIYYTTTTSVQTAKNLTRLDRQAKPTDASNVNKQNSQRLKGTPTEWLRMGLIFPRNPIPMQVLKLTANQLSESIKDGVDLQIIDLRPSLPGHTEESPFQQAFRWMPHEVISNSPKLSKDKWTVLVGLSSEDEQPFAFELFKKGYVLTAFLEGGYPAWISATSR